MAAIEVRMPQMGESIIEGTLTKWHKRPGDVVRSDEPLFEISTDKVDTEVPSPAAGVLVSQAVAEGAVVAVGATVAVIETQGAAAAPQAPAPEVAPQSWAPPPPPPAQASNDAPVHKAAGPLVRRMAQDQGVDLQQVPGSGAHGRVTREDLLTFVATNAAPAPTPQEPAVPQGTAAQIPRGDLVDGVRVERVPMTAMRKKIAEHMVRSKHTSPHVTSVIEIDMQRIVDLRAAVKGKFEAAHGFKLSFMPFFLSAALEGIRAVPLVNASVEGDMILYKKDVNLGVAVALDWGLIVPVIRGAGERNFVGLGRELEALATKARSKKLSPEDVQSGTFSISNYGGFGTVIGQPIINQPQVAIMGIGALTRKPVAVGDAIAIRTMVYCVLTFDHRVIDGQGSGTFLSKVKDTLENWNTPLI